MLILNFVTKSQQKQLMDAKIVKYKIFGNVVDIRHKMVIFSINVSLFVAMELPINMKLMKVTVI